MFATSQFHWNAFEIVSAIAALLLAAGTFIMALSTWKLAKTSDEQKTIASRSEFAARQPVAIPVDSGPYRKYMIPRSTPSWNVWWGNELASYWLINGDDISIRLLLRNVGRGVLALPADREAPQILSTIGRGVQVDATPSNRSIAQDETFEISYRGPVNLAAKFAAASWPSGDIPAVILDFAYTDLTESMEMRCQIFYKQSEGHELRAFKTRHTQPYPATPSQVPFSSITLPTRRTN